MDGKFLESQCFILNPEALGENELGLHPNVLILSATYCWPLGHRVPISRATVYHRYPILTWRTFLSSSSPVTTATRAGWDFGGLRCSSWYAIAASASDLWGLSWLGELGPDASAQECAKSASVLSSSSVLKRPHFQHNRHELCATTYI